MSFGDFMGLGAVLIALVSVVAIFSEMYKRRLAFLERKLELTAGAAAEKAAQYATYNSELESRLRVVERIVTDSANGLDIARQIESLRDGDNVRVSKQ